MSSKVAHYLQEHLIGEVLDSARARRYFATDASVFTVTPSLITYPRNENDVRKTARFSWQLAERGRLIPITARGLGTDQGGAAIGSGIVMVFPAHLNRILELDSKTGMVTVEPGLNFGKLQQTLYTHNRFVPSFPASYEYSTIGGAIANNSAGERSFKYGATRQYVKGLRVVLANGEVIETKRLAKRELNKKLGLATLEGEIYRALDALIEENTDTIESMRRGVSKNTAGYDLLDVKQKDGSFDLTPLIVGSQGTLGIVTEAILATEIYNPASTLTAVFCDDIQVAEQVIGELRKMSDGPATIEAVDQLLLEMVEATMPNQLKGVITKPFPKMVLLVEFDNFSPRLQKRMVKKAQKIFNHYQLPFKTETTEAAKDKLWRLRHAASAVLAGDDQKLRAVPFIDDGIVPPEQLKTLLEGIYALIDRHHLQTGIWGHAGDGNFHLQPLLDLNQVGDRQKLFKVLDEYYSLVISLGGSTSAEHGDGRLRAPYLAQQYGEAAYALLQKVKQIFDPYNILNPGVKIGVNLEDIKPLLRTDYAIDQLYDHLPHS